MLNSIISDIKQLTTKNAARLALMKSFSWCCITNAIGGPPIDVLVPMNPERKPAQKSDLPFALKMILLMLRATATRTDRPSQSASAFWSIHSSRKPPDMVPGILPKIANFKPRNEIERQWLYEFATDKVNAEIVMGAGTYSGSIRKRMGAATIAKPKPMEL